MSKDRGVGILKQETYGPRSEREHFSVVAESWKICPEQNSEQEYSRVEVSANLENTTQFLSVFQTLFCSGLLPWQVSQVNIRHPLSAFASPYKLGLVQTEL